MKRNIITFVVAAMMLSGLFACANMQPREKILVCQEVLKLAQPECERLVAVGEGYAELCTSTVDDAIIACEAGILKDARLACPIIKSKLLLCGFIPDDSPQRDANVALCERVIRASAIACTIALSSNEDD